MSLPHARREFAKSLIDRSIRSALAASVAGKPRRAFADLLWRVQSRSALLRPACHVGQADAAPFEGILNGLLALSEERRSWVRPIDAWEPVGVGPLPLFSSLAHHLFAEYPVPPVLLSAWTGGTGYPAKRRQGWFRHVGRGGSLRTARFPIHLTKRMAHEFAHAPATFPIEFALRWAQVRGLGGSDRLARAIAASRLGVDLRNEDFWLPVIHLFLNTPRLALEEVGAIIDYLHDRKFRYRPAIIGEGTEIELDPPEPDLSIKGRTVASLMRRVVAWRAEARPARPEKILIRWEGLGLHPYHRDDGAGGAWTIRELLDSDALAAEGEAMHHCVATYTAICSKRRSSIWSLGVERPDGRDRLMTIEVDPATRQVIQAKRKCNREPDAACLAILRDWAGREGLNLDALDDGEA
ncbi:PcfJ domain-containing protein [Tundrisphaera sp. TA3]|uniref:PcfJ domain-containing protein n=1 Tax=Tundrisphaera sp. TA3 TaxID=3435775 RepID=UPI003EBB0E48